MCESSKKHFTQMTKAEIWYLKLKINSLKKSQLTLHTIKRMKQKNISEFEIKNAFKEYDIIEYHNKNGNKVLIRSKKAINGFNTVISVCIDNGYIITGYKNMVNDRHRTINWSNYDRDLDILSYILEINKNELEEM